MAKGPPNFLLCEASCYIPEHYPFEVRVADGLYHLRDVSSALVEYRDALHLRAVRHSQHDHVLACIEKALRETSYLKNSWSNFEANGISPETMRIAEKQVPFTRSPFPSLFRELGDYVERDQDSKVNWIELNLKMAITIPNFGISVGRQDPRVIADFMLHLLK
jgi:hypothetical protein